MPRAPSLPALALLALAPTAAAQTPVSGDQWGTWTLAGSPYQLVGDVRVPPGMSLTVEPGVKVVGMGPHGLTVGAGARLAAVGTAASPIRFTAQDPVAGWDGVQLLGADDASRLEYCTFARGRAPVFPPPGPNGGNLYVEDCSPVILRCIFRDGSTHTSSYTGFGGGLCTLGSNSLIQECLFIGNSADSGGGLCVLARGSPLVLRCRFLGNTASYAGGGIYMSAGTNPVLDGNLIAGNHSDGWGGGGVNSWTSFVFSMTYPVLRNNVIVWNTTSAAGGGVYCRYDHAVLTNDIIAFNSAATSGGGIYALNFGGGDAVEAGNCILWGNSAPAGPQIHEEAGTGSLVRVSWSDVEGGWTGTGNIAADPLFLDVLGPDGLGGTGDEDFRLGAGSPCIDAGNNTLLSYLVELDVAGRARYLDDPATPDTGFGAPPQVDLGAHEFQVPNLFGPNPGTAGTWNTWEVAGVEPGETVAVGWALALGSSPVPGCPGLASDLAGPALVGSLVADATGRGSIGAPVPAAASGRTVLFQALARDTCRLTEVVGWVFP